MIPPAQAPARGVSVDAVPPGPTDTPPSLPHVTTVCFQPRAPRRTLSMNRVELDPEPHLATCSCGWHRRSSNPEFVRQWAEGHREEHS